MYKLGGIKNNMNFNNGKIIIGIVSLYAICVIVWVLGRENPNLKSDARIVIMPLCADNKSFKDNFFSYQYMNHVQLILQQKLEVLDMISPTIFEKNSEMASYNSFSCQKNRSAEIAKKSNAYYLTEVFGFFQKALQQLK